MKTSSLKPLPDASDLPNDHEFQKRKQRVLDMMAGKITPPNKMVKYLVEKLRHIHAERDTITKNLEEMNKQAQLFASRRDDLNAQSRSYFDDVAEFDKPEE